MDEAQGTSIRWLVPNAQKNEMEPILISIAPKSETVIDYPHEGEEFGYVLSGQIQVHVGDITHTAKKGDSFYIYPYKQHFLSNNRNTTAQVLWISSPPSF